MEYVGRPVIFATAAALQLACLVAMLNWEPNPSQPMVFFVISGVWGIADGVWSPQIKGWLKYTIIILWFAKNAAFVPFAQMVVDSK